MKIDLSHLDKAQKVDFLKKLASGKYKLGSSELEKLDFERLESGQYICTQTGEKYNQDQIDQLAEKYMIQVEFITDLKEPADSYQLIPANNLDSLLVKN